MKITEFIVGHWSNLGFSWSLGHSHLKSNILQYQEKNTIESFGNFGHFGILTS